MISEYINIESHWDLTTADTRDATTERPRHGGGQVECAVPAVPGMGTSHGLLAGREDYCIPALGGFAPVGEDGRGVSDGSSFFVPF